MIREGAKWKDLPVLDDRSASTYQGWTGDPSPLTPRKLQCYRSSLCSGPITRLAAFAQTRKVKAFRPRRNLLLLSVFGTTELPFLKPPTKIYTAKCKMSMPIEHVFQTTLDKFKTRLSPRELNDFQFTSLEDVQRTILQIQDVQDTRKTMMDMSRIQSFLEAMNEFGKVIEVFLNVSDFVAFIWGPMKFMLQVRCYIFLTGLLPLASFLIHASIGNCLS
jgi:hypothetical protein